MPSANDFSPLLGKPIRSIQTCLRALRKKYDNMPTLIVDGIYGNQTVTAVQWFQQMHHLPATGNVNKATWDAIVLEYLILQKELEAPYSIHILSDDFTKICPGDRHYAMYSIQSLLKTIASELETVADLELTGIHDEKSQNSVKSVQIILGQEPSGIIDKEFWNALTQLYRVHVSNSLFQRS